MTSADRARTGAAGRLGEAVDLALDAAGASALVTAIGILWAMRGLLLDRRDARARMVLGTRMLRAGVLGMEALAAAGLLKAAALVPMAAWLATLLRLLG